MTNTILNDWHCVPSRRNKNYGQDIPSNVNLRKLDHQQTHCWPWWRHQMETFSALLALCAGNSPVPGEFPTQRPVTRSFDVYFDLRPNKRLSKQSWGWWCETQSRPFDVIVMQQSYRQTFSISRALVSNTIVDHSDVVGGSTVGASALHLHSRLYTWLQWIGQRQLQDKTRII